MHSLNSDLSTKILKATLELILKHGWLSLNLNDIARHAKISLSEMYSLYPHKINILEAFFQDVNQETLDHLEQFEEEESSKNRLFSVVMTRFDVLAMHKQVMAILWREAWGYPCFLKQLLPKGLNTTYWILQASDMDITGVLGQLRLNVFGLSYLSIIRTWLQDESPDMAPTMAYVDQRIHQLDQIPGFF